MPRKTLFSLLIACGSSSAVAMRSSRLMSSISKALRIWVQPARRSCATSSWSRVRSNCVFTASGVVVTWLSASAVAKILTRSDSIGRCTGSSQRREAAPGSKSALQNGFLACPVPSRDKFPQCCKRAASSRPSRADIEPTYSLISAHHPVEIIPKSISLARPSPRPRCPSRRRAGGGRKQKRSGPPAGGPDAHDRIASRLLCCRQLRRLRRLRGSRLGGCFLLALLEDERVALARDLAQPVHHGAGSRRDQAADDDVLLEAFERIHLAVDRGLGEHARGLLERR